MPLNGRVDGNPSIRIPSSDDRTRLDGIMVGGCNIELQINLHGCRIKILQCIAHRYLSGDDSRSLDELQSRGGCPQRICAGLGNFPIRDRDEPGTFLGRLERFGHHDGDALAVITDAIVL